MTQHYRVVFYDTDTGTWQQEHHAYPYEDKGWIWDESISDNGWRFTEGEAEERLSEALDEVLNEALDKLRKVEAA